MEAGHQVAWTSLDDIYLPIQTKLLVSAQAIKHSPTRLIWLKGVADEALDEQLEWPMTEGIKKATQWGSGFFEGMLRWHNKQLLAQSNQVAHVRSGHKAQNGVADEALARPDGLIHDRRQ